MSERILLVEDDGAIAEMVAAALSRNGFDCVHAQDASEAQGHIEGMRPVLVLMDWMLPGISGIEFTRRLRRDERTRELPIIMLTARYEEVDTVAGFDAGVDDFVGKPFSVSELMVRIRAVLRRTARAPNGTDIEVSGLRLEPASHRVTARGASVSVGPTEFRLLRFFMENQERVFTRSQILDNVWGSNVYVEERTVDVHIRRLRKSISAKGHDRLIQTVRGTGYRFSRRREHA